MTGGWAIGSAGDGGFIEVDDAQGKGSGVIIHIMGSPRVPLPAERTWWQRWCLGGFLALLWLR